MSSVLFLLARIVTLLVIFLKLGVNYSLLEMIVPEKRV